MSNLVPPHGGKLSPLLIGGDEREEALKEAKTLPKVRLNSREISDLIMLGMGAFSPLLGFMGKSDYEKVVAEMRLQNGLLWPIPITLSVSKEDAQLFSEGGKVALLNPEQNEIMGTMLIQEKYFYDKKTEALQVFGTDDRQHPGVNKMYAQNDVYLGGRVAVLSEGGYREAFHEFATPAEARAIFADKGWKTVAAFQTRNPIHRSHEYLTKVALEVCDGLFIHPIVGKLKADDIPAEIRMKCYNILLKNYYPKERVVLKVYPMEMRYAGPKEAVLHAIIRQNFGCSHFIVGRDHAGVGSYYGPFDAQKIFDQLAPEDLYIRPLKMDLTFWCNKCDSMASTKTCPHSAEDHLLISGTDLREMLSQGKSPPEHFSRPEVIEILVNSFYANRDKI